MKRIVILGSTGSIGTNTLDIISKFPEKFQAVGLTAGNNVDKLEEQVRTFSPAVVAMADPSAAQRLRARCKGLKTTILNGTDGLMQAATLPEADLVISAIVGGAGLVPTLAAIKAGKFIALANKEPMVMAGRPITIGSLFARAMNLPALIAASVGTSPAPPTMAEMTRSASGSVAACMSPSVPFRIVVFRPLHRARRRSAAAGSAMATTAGENVRTCSSSLSTLLAAVRPTAWNFSGNLLMMSRVLVPMDPVEPRMTIRFMRVVPQGVRNARRP